MVILHEEKPKKLWRKWGKLGKCGLNMVLMGKLMWEHMGNCETNGDFDGTSYEEILEKIGECGQNAVKKLGIQGNQSGKNMIHQWR